MKAVSRERHGSPDLAVLADLIDTGKVVITHRCCPRDGRPRINRPFEHVC
jgi:hypothetical protein